MSKGKRVAWLGSVAVLVSLVTLAVRHEPRGSAMRATVSSAAPIPTRGAEADGSDGISGPGSTTTIISNSLMSAGLGFLPLTPAFPPAVARSVRDAYAAERRCMIDHGVKDYPPMAATMGDGHTAGPLIGGPPGSDMDSGTAVFQHAGSACAPEMQADGAVEAAAEGVDANGNALDPSSWPPMSPAGSAPTTRPAYPVGKRAAVVAAASTLQACMRRHGVADFPTVPSSYGDGKTASPTIGGAPGRGTDPTGPTYQGAQTRCLRQIDELHRVMLVAAGELP
jgi:hypothetical protein